MSRFDEESDEYRFNPYVRFSLAVKKAEADAEFMHLDTIHRAGLKNWQAHAWILERTKPERFGKREQIEIHDKRAIELLQALKRASEAPGASSLREAMGNTKVIEAKTKPVKQLPSPVIVKESANDDKPDVEHLKEVFQRCHSRQKKAQKGAEAE